MKVLNILIADDELPARGELAYEISLVPGTKVIDICKNGKEVLYSLKKHPSIDLVFLDIEMPIMNGLEVARRIREQAPDIKFVFATGFSQFAVEAFELEAFDYILKPYQKERITYIIQKLQRTLDKENNFHSVLSDTISDDEKLFITGKESSIMINPRQELVFISTEKSDHSFFYTTHGIVESPMTLKSAEELLSNCGFFRTSKGYIVNLNMIYTIENQVNSTLTLRMDHYPKLKIPVSRHYIKQFRNAIQRK